MSASISTIPHLISELNKCKNEDFKKIVKRLDLSSSDYKPFEFWQEKHYTRNCVHRTMEYELILLCWEIGQETPIHCHNDQECWVHIVKGEFKEIRFKQGENGLQIDNEQTFMKEGLCYMNDDMGFHKLQNISKEKAISLHLYANPIDKCRVFNEKTECFELKEMSYYSEEGVLV